MYLKYIHGVKRDRDYARGNTVFCAFHPDDESEAFSLMEAITDSEDFSIFFDGSDTRNVEDISLHSVLKNVDAIIYCVSKGHIDISSAYRNCIFSQAQKNHTPVAVVCLNFVEDIQRHYAGQTIFDGDDMRIGAKISRLINETAFQPSDNSRLLELILLADRIGEADYEDIARIYLNKNGSPDYENAIMWQEKNIERYRTRYAESDSANDIIRYLYHLTLIIEMKYDSGDLSGAIDSAEKLQVFCQSESDGPHVVFIARYRVFAYDWLAWLYEKRDGSCKTSIAIYNEQIQEDEQAVLQSNTIANNRALVKSCLNAADCVFKNGMYKAAKHIYSLARDVYKKILAADSSADNPVEYSCILNCIGICAYKLGDNQEAYKMFMASLETLTSEDVYVGIMEEQRENVAVAEYNVAFACDAGGMTQSALDHVEKSIKELSILKRGNEGNKANPVLKRAYMLKSKLLKEVGKTVEATESLNAAARVKTISQTDETALPFWDYIEYRNEQQTVIWPVD